MHHSTQNESLSDETICQMVVRGDSERFALLITRYEAKLLRYVIYLIHDEVAAADVVQETFIKAYRNLQGFDTKLQFSSWIYRIAHNEAINSIKYSRRFVRTDVDDMEDMQHDVEPHMSIADKIDSDILHGDVVACMQKIPQRYRDVLILQYYENMKYSQIADVLRIPVSTVGVWASRGKGMLKKICQQKGVRS